MKKILILGASGLVGGESLQRALAEPRVESVIAPTRRPLPSHAKLTNPIAPELDSLLPDAAGWGVDAVICALGTTIAKAGSKGASASSLFFYTRIKGELERDIQRIGFKSLSIVRPNIIGGDRGEFRLAESLLLRLFRTLTPILPRGFRISPAARIAEVLVEAAVATRPGLHIVHSDTLV